ncbi:MAG: LptF/LptG family permease, partial [Pseudomonadota bacterium]
MNKYIIREVLKGSFGALVVLLALFNFFTLTTELKELGKGSYGLMQIFQYLALTSPRVTYELVPFGALLGSLLVLGAMSNNREVVGMRAAGFSVFRIIGAVLQAGLILVVFSLVVGEFIAPLCERSAQMIKMTSQNQQVALTTRYGFWVRDGNMFINIRQILNA